MPPARASEFFSASDTSDAGITPPSSEEAASPRSNKLNMFPEKKHSYMIHQLQGMFGATDPWPQITVHREHAARYAATLQTTIETFRTSLENLQPSQPNYGKVSTYLQNKLDDMYDRCCEVKEWSVVPFAFQEDDSLVPFEDQGYTPSSHDVMIKRGTVKPMGKPLVTATECGKIAFSSPQPITTTQQRRIDKFSREDPTFLTESEKTHVIGTDLPVKVNLRGSRAQGAHRADASISTVAEVIMQQNPTDKFLDMLSKRASGSVPAYLTSVDPNNTISSAHMLGSCFSAYANIPCNEKAFSEKSPKVAALEQVRDQMRARRSVNKGDNPPSANNTTVPAPPTPGVHNEPLAARIDHENEGYDKPDWYESLLHDDRKLPCTCTYSTTWNGMPCDACTPKHEQHAKPLCDDSWNTCGQCSKCTGPAQSMAEAIATPMKRSLASMTFGCPLPSMYRNHPSPFDPSFILSNYLNNTKDITPEEKEKAKPYVEMLPKVTDQISTGRADIARRLAQDEKMGSGDPVITPAYETLSELLKNCPFPLDDDTSRMSAPNDAWTQYHNGESKITPWESVNNRVGFSRGCDSCCTIQDGDTCETCDASEVFINNDANIECLTCGATHIPSLKLFKPPVNATDDKSGNSNQTFRICTPGPDVSWGHKPFSTKYGKQAWCTSAAGRSEPAGGGWGVRSEEWIPGDNWETTGGLNSGDARAVHEEMPSKVGKIKRWKDTPHQSLQETDESDAENRVEARNESISTEGRHRYMTADHALGDWTYGKERRLMYLKTTYPNRPWADIATELGILAWCCKDRFESIKPRKSQLSATEKQQDQKNGLQGKSHTFFIEDLPDHDDSMSCDRATGAKIPVGRNYGTWDCGLNNNDHRSEEWGGTRHVRDLSDDGWGNAGGASDRGVAKNPPGAVGLDRVTVDDVRIPTSHGWGNTNDVRDALRYGQGVCHPISAHIGSNRGWNNPSTPPVSEHPESDRGGVCPSPSVTKRPKKDYDSKSNIPMVLKRANDSTTDITASNATPKSEPIPPAPKAYTVTYWATVKCGDYTSHIPIDNLNVSGPVKAILDGPAKKVWKWVQDKGLGDNVSLQDAFDLAKDMEGNEDDEEVEIIRDDGSETVQGGEDDTVKDEEDETVHRFDDDEEEGFWFVHEHNLEIVRDNKGKAGDADKSFIGRFNHPDSRSSYLPPEYGWGLSGPSRAGSPALKESSDTCESHGCTVEDRGCGKEYSDAFRYGNSRRHPPDPIWSLEGMSGANTQARVESPECCGRCEYPVEGCRCGSGDGWGRS
jgi:hypothetical protein